MSGPLETASVVRTGCQLDATGEVQRIGVVLFDEDVTSEDDLARLRGDALGLSVLVARMPLPVDHSADGLDKTRADLLRAAATLAPSARLDAICYGCTTGTLELGFESLAKAFAEQRPGVPLATPISGAVAALRRLKATKIALITPYPDALNNLIVDALAANGVTVVRQVVIEGAEEIAYSRISAGSLRAAAAAAMTSSAEALFISCTALKATSLIRELELTHGRPVLTSTQAMWWEALSLIGRRGPGPGQIFET